MILLSEPVTITISNNMFCLLALVLTSQCQRFDSSNCELYYIYLEDKYVVLCLHAQSEVSVFGDRVLQRVSQASCGMSY